MERMSIAETALRGDVESKERRRNRRQLRQHYCTIGLLSARSQMTEEFIGYDSTRRKYNNRQS